jgi:hypothetical protein
MKINPWFRCMCGKLHLANFVDRQTRCKCGRLLYIQVPIRSTNARGDIK